MRVAPHRPGRRAVAAVAGLLMLSSAIVAAPSVFAEPQRTIAEVEAQLEELHNQAEMAAEELNGARVRLDEIHQKQAATKDRAKRAGQALASQSRDLGQMASVAYRSGGLDASVQLLMAEDPADFLQQSAALEVVAKTRNAVLRKTTAARLSLAQANATLAQQEAEAAAIEQEIAQHKATIEASIAQEQQVLSQLKEEERRRLEAERKARAERERRAAEAAKAAADKAAREAQLRAASAANNEDTTGSSSSSGGSSGGSSGSSGGQDTTPGPDDNGSDSVNSGGGSGQNSGFVGSDQAAIAVAAALAQVGEPYTYDAHPPDTWDCSKLTAWAWGQAGVQLTPYSYTQATEVRKISTDELRPGDLIFYFNGAHHVSMYIGNGQIVEAANPSAGVRVTDLWNNWSRRTFSMAGRPVG